MTIDSPPVRYITESIVTLGNGRIDPRDPGQ